MLLPVAVNALSIRNVLVLGVSEQTVENMESADQKSLSKHLHQRQLMEKMKGYFLCNQLRFLL